jgi:hypothetical protein
MKRGQQMLSMLPFFIQPIAKVLAQSKIAFALIATGKYRHPAIEDIAESQPPGNTKFNYLLIKNLKMSFFA